MYSWALLSSDSRNPSASHLRHDNTQVLLPVSLWEAPSLLSLAFPPHIKAQWSLHPTSVSHQPLPPDCRDTGPLGRKQPISQGVHHPAREALITSSHISAPLTQGYIEGCINPVGHGGVHNVCWAVVFISGRTQVKQTLLALWQSAGGLALKLQD